MEPVPVDLGRRDHANRERPRGRHDRAEQLLTLGNGELLRVVQPRKRANPVIAQALVVEQDPGDDQRPGQAASSGLVDARDEAEAELAVELEKAPSPIP